ncbi:MAG: hypothetical protein ABJZ55_12330 [Fuerstiella sp.]
MAAIQDFTHVAGQSMMLDGEQYYQIANSHLMPEFFMSLVGQSDHWMFLSSHGALTAGRQNADNALFPYASDDQISATRGTTGPVTQIRIEDVSSWDQQAWDGSEPSAFWEPFALPVHGSADVRRNLYKTALGNKLVFEEINESLELTFRYRWAFSDRFGFVRSCHLENTGGASRRLDLLDGFRNILPHGVGSDFQMRFSNLGNAYKKCELIRPSQAGLFYLSSIPSDRAEPSEGLRATTVWQTGLMPSAVLLSCEQMSAFRAGREVTSEIDVRGKAGAYLLNQSLELAAGESLCWSVVAEVGQDHCDVIQLNEWLESVDDAKSELAEDIQWNERGFLKILSSSDAIQCGANSRRSDRHLSNTVFNVMRGGIPLNSYLIPLDDFKSHVRQCNLAAFQRNERMLHDLPESLSTTDLRKAIQQINDPDLNRLTLEYLPLAFSRRHGDPTRPWNHFSIDLRSENGSTNLNYQGNWRDIFQNWEALGLSFPRFFDSMICRFVNATTADGYNPYRLTKQGFEWEEPAPEDPWANIGYWGDHQIIYLLKLLEWSRRFDGGHFEQLLTASDFVHANVPYRILDSEQIRLDPRNTIQFDADMAAVIDDRVKKVGADGKLVYNQSGQIHYVSLVEKLLTLSLAKLSNFVPDGGIWLNTQRPEWNDANNALVGNGLSLVTTCYLRRWFQFLEELLADVKADHMIVSVEVVSFFRDIKSALKAIPQQSGPLSGSNREKIVLQLSKAGSDYRSVLYDSGLSGESDVLSRVECLEFFNDARHHLESTIQTNERADGLYHSYNLLNWSDRGIEIEHFYEMLEGQVAVLSSGVLSSAAVLKLLGALRSSSLYRANQNSYLLYPDRTLSRFLSKNSVAVDAVADSKLIQDLLASGNESVVRRDVLGGVHFSGQLKNASDLKVALEQLPSEYAGDVALEASGLVDLFEETFGHRQFTGRSGAFFAYEGLGSIYWHMVSKLALAVSENFFWAVDAGAAESTTSALRDHWDEIRAGIGAEKSPLQYGAFPSDPYSHTPENAGVKQPGMTGQVKEDILSRFAEIGVHIEAGCLCFRMDLFDHEELLEEDSSLTFFNLHGVQQTVSIPAKGFGFTLFQVPVVYQAGETDKIEVEFFDGESRIFQGLCLDAEISGELFSRKGQIAKMTGHFRCLSYSA